MLQELFYPVLDLVFVAGGTVSGYQFTEEAGEEHHHADKDGYESQVEQGLVGDIAELQAVYLRDDLVDDQPEGDDEAYEEEHDAPDSEDVHGFLAKAGEEPYRHQVEEAVEEAAHAELALSVFALAVDDDFLAYPGESGVLGYVGDVAVHVPVDLYLFDHLTPVGLKTAVHVVQLQAGYLAGGEVVYLRGYVLGEGVVVADFLPAGHQVVAVLAYHAVELRNLVRAVLQVRVHGDDHVSGGLAEACLEGCRLAVVAAEAVGADMRIDSVEFLYRLPGAVVAAVVYHQYLVFDAGYGRACDGPVYPLRQLAEGLVLVVEGNYYRKVHGVILRCLDIRMCC